MSARAPAPAKPCSAWLGKQSLRLDLPSQRIQLTPVMRRPLSSFSTRTCPASSGGAHLLTLDAYLHPTETFILKICILGRGILSIFCLEGQILECVTRRAGWEELSVPLSHSTPRFYHRGCVRCDVFTYIITLIFLGDHPLVQRDPCLL